MIEHYQRLTQGFFQDLSRGVTSSLPNRCVGRPTPAVGFVNQNIPLRLSEGHENEKQKTKIEAKLAGSFISKQ